MSKFLSSIEIEGSVKASSFLVGSTTVVDTDGRIDYGRLKNLPTTYTPKAHNHDDRYYTETELQTSGSSQVHWNNLTNKPTTFEPSSHNHNDIYYTESEINTLLNGKQDTLGFTPVDKAGDTINNSLTVSRSTAGTAFNINVDGEHPIDFRIGHNSYNYRFRFTGNESGSSNALELWSYNADTEGLQAFRVAQDGVFRIIQDGATINGRTIYHTGNFDPSTKANASHSHSPTDINQSSSYRFVTDAEKSTWNSKANGSHTHSISNITNLQTSLDSKSDVGHTHTFASLTSKPTTISGYGITNAYTKTEVDTKISAIVDSAPETLNTLNELAQALGDDPNFATTVSNQIGLKANSADVYTKTNLQTSGQASVHWSNLTNKPSTFNPSSHNHDDRYYTESEIDTMLSGKSDNHSHPYLPLSGGTMATDSQIHFDASNTDLDFIRLGYNGGTTLGWMFRYTGTGSGNENALEIHSSTARAIRITQDGVATFDSTPKVGSNNIWHEGSFDPSTKANSSHTHSASDITQTSSYRFVTDSEKNTWNNKSNFSGSFNDLTDVPTSYTPESHTHPASEIVESSSKRFVSDTEKSTWNGKQNALGFTPVNKAGDTMTGDLTVDNGTTTTVKVISDDTGESALELYGASQGTGRLYVGQSTTHGGGIEYNGDNNPSTSGAGADYVALYRRASSSNHWTAKNKYDSNDWEFRGKVYAETNKEVFHEGNQPRTTVSTTAPSSPRTNDIWIDIS